MPSTNTNVGKSLAKTGVFIFLLLFSAQLFSQIDEAGLDIDIRVFSIETEVDTIEFIKIDSSIQFKRPVFIMLQGSLPIPLVINSGARTHYTSFPYSNKEIKKTHHVINISMPHIPIKSAPDQIRNDGRMIDPSPKYNKNNYLGNYVRRTNEVISFLVQQPWVDTSQIVLFGHSQGSYVAIKVAKENPAVSLIALSSFNPTGRVSGQVNRIRALEHLGQISTKEAQKKISEFYDRWSYLVKNAEDDTEIRGDTFKATVSFSEDFTDDLLSLNIPIYVMYGSKDYGALGCDLLPIQFELAEKTNYQHAVFPGLGHNYEEIAENGQSDFGNMHWQKAFDSFTHWLYSFPQK